MSRVELLEAQGSATLGALLALLLTLGCFLYASGVLALIRDAHRAAMQRVHDDTGRPLRWRRNPATPDYEHGEATSWHRPAE